MAVNEAFARSTLWGRGRRLWRAVTPKLGSVDYAAIVKHVREDGRLSGRYAFMNLMACAIATLGLLLSSPAVIIGAMLISPLMGPIVQFGMSLCILDLRALRSSLLSLAIGIALALAISFGIVWLSPLTEVTPEIIARTQPNLFDLLVAIFSGLAGGYAVIIRKGETIVGVAIATALMPPLCVTGYGIATGSFAIASGAAFLFMTNLLAIALSVTLLAKLYGFGSSHSPTHTIWQSALIVVTFMALSVPLGLALKRIAVQAQVATLARAAIDQFYSGTQSRVSEFKIDKTSSGETRVNAVVLGRKYLPSADHDLQALIDKETGRHIVLSLDQVMIDRDVSLEQSELLREAENSVAEPLESRLEALQQKQSLHDEMIQAAPFKVGALDLDDAKHVARLYPAPGIALPLAAYHEAETDLAARYPGWKIRLTPPALPLPSIYFDDASAKISQAAAAAIADTAWTLDRWHVGEIEVIGHSSSTGSSRANEKLAKARAQAVLGALMSKTVNGTAVAQPPSSEQHAEERQYGLRRFQRVDVNIVSLQTSALTGASSVASPPVPQPRAAKTPGVDKQ
jgi:uncharacterized hydrophobic protein (TIGR00271 family)